MSLSESLLLNNGAAHLVSIVSSSHTSVHRITRCHSSSDDDDDFRCSEKEQKESNRLFLPPHKLQQVKYKENLNYSFNFKSEFNFGLRLFKTEKRFDEVQIFL